MTFLPIVERELRVAARKRSTFWLRPAAGLVALAMGGGCILLSTLARSGTAGFGSNLFAVLTWLGLGAALCAGMFFTADCLSEEKREGTLGFLLLTDLRGYDVVLGKLFVTSLRACYALLAVLPILGVTLLMGGVAGVQFWKTTLSLLNALFLSLAAGLLVSAISRDSQKALAATFLLLLGLTCGGPVADWLRSELVRRPLEPWFSLSSPVYVFRMAGAWGRSSYWSGLVLSQFIGWLLLAGACVLIPHTWQERAGRTRGAVKDWAFVWRYGTRRRRAALRHHLIEVNPVLWLACRERWQALSVWVWALFICCTGIVLVSTHPSSSVWMVWNSISSLFILALYVWIASHASRFFVEIRRSGLVELLLVSPVHDRQIVLGQWRALLRMFGLPVLLLLLAQVTALCLAQEASWGGVGLQMGAATLKPAITLVTVVVSYLVSALNLFALSWFGMWMGLTSANTSAATLKTIVFAQVIPWFVVSFVAGIATMLLAVQPLWMRSTSATSQTVAVRTMAWLPLFATGLTASLNVAKDLGFFLWSRKKLFGSFREQASRSDRPRHAVSVPRWNPPVVPPPVIAAQP